MGTSDEPSGGKRGLFAKTQEQETNSMSYDKADEADSSPADGSPTDEPPKQFYLLTHPRSASNLLIQILNLGEQRHVLTKGEKAGYYFEPLIFKMDEFRIWGTDIAGWTAEQHAESRATADECYADFAKDLEKLESDPGLRSMFVKEHYDFLRSPATHAKPADRSVSILVKQPMAIARHEATQPWILDGGIHSEGNDTLLSDGFMLKWMPTFLVRHPALAYPSHLRAAKELNWSGMENAEDDAGMALQCTLAGIRKLYEFFDEKLSPDAKQYGGIDWPIVLTGDVVMTEPETIKRYASLVRLDAQKLRFQWKPRTKEKAEKMHKNQARMLSTLIASAGIDKSKTSEAIDIESEVLKWRKEFGDRATNSLEGWVRAAMPDYEFFLARRLRAEPTVVDGRRV